MNWFSGPKNPLSSKTVVSKNPFFAKGHPTRVNPIFKQPTVTNPVIAQSNAKAKELNELAYNIFQQIPRMNYYGIADYIRKTYGTQLNELTKEDVDTIIKKVQTFVGLPLTGGRRKSRQSRRSRQSRQSRSRQSRRRQS